MIISYKKIKELGDQYLNDRKAFELDKSCNIKMAINKLCIYLIELLKHKISSAFAIKILKYILMIISSCSNKDFYSDVRDLGKLFQMIYKSNGVTPNDMQSHIKDIKIIYAMHRSFSSDFFLEFCQHRFNLIVDEMCNGNYDLYKKGFIETYVKILRKLEINKFIRVINNLNIQSILAIGYIFIEIIPHENHNTKNNNNETPNYYVPLTIQERYMNIILVLFVRLTKSERNILLKLYCRSTVFEHEYCLLEKKLNIYINPMVKKYMELSMDYTDKDKRFRNEALIKLNIRIH